MKDIESIVDTIEKGEIEKGLNLLEKLEKKTSDHNKKYTIAQTYYELGHLEKAKSIIEELILLYPDEGELFIFLAEILIDFGEEDEAIEMLLEVNENDPVFLQGQLLLADLYQMQGLDEVAEQKLLRAIELAPNESIVAYGLGEFYFERGDYKKSIRYFKQVIQQNEKLPNVNVELRLAEAYSATGLFEDAIPYYQKGLTENVELSSLFGFGFTAYQLGDYRLAIEQLLVLKELDPEYGSLYPYLAKAYEAQYLYDDAIKVLNEGIKLGDFNEELYLLAGKLSLKMKNSENGEEYLRQVLAINPSHFEAVRTLAALLKEEERFEELLELIDYIKDFGEDDPLFTWFEASAHSKLESFEMADGLYKEISLHFENDPDFLEEYGQFKLENGERKLAKKMFLQAISLDPSRIYLHELLMDLEE